MIRKRTNMVKNPWEKMREFRVLSGGESHSDERGRRVKSRNSNLALIYIKVPD